MENVFIQNGSHNNNNILKLHVEHVLIPQEFEYENFIFAENVHNF